MMRQTFAMLLLAVLALFAAVPVGAQAAPAAEEAAEKPAEKPAEESADKPKDERISFSVKLTGVRGGGKAEGRAGAFEYQEGEYLIATGGVEIKFQDLIFKAERARIDIPTNLLTAEGNVILDEGPQRLTGTTLEYNLDTRTGRVTNATAFVDDPGYVFSGDEIAKIGEQTYRAVDGIFTSCLDQKVPDWSLRMSTGEVTLGGYAKIKNARMRFKNVPMFYFPYILWPAKTDRSSGFLVPKPGYSSRRGGYLGLAYFQTLGRSADTTFFVDLFTEQYFGFGNEIRYKPSERTQGAFRAHLIMEPGELDPEFTKIPLDTSWKQGDDRWKVQLFHETNQIFGRFRGVISYEDYSDFDYLQDYERSVNLQAKSVIRSQGYLTGNFGNSSLNILAEQTERIRRGSASALRQLPEVEYRVRNARLGNTPLYLSLLSSVSVLESDNSSSENGIKLRYNRTDIFPTLSVPLSSLTWLSAKLDLSYRATLYSKSGVERPDTVPDTADVEAFFKGGSLTRSYAQVALEVTGPSFSRIFEKKVGGFGKFKHIIEPRISYLYIPDLDDTLTTQDDRFDRTSRIIQFDEVDGVTPANFAIFSITNRLLAKPLPKKKEEAEADAARKEAIVGTVAEEDEGAASEILAGDGSAAIAEPATQLASDEEPGSEEPGAENADGDEVATVDGEEQVATATPEEPVVEELPAFEIASFEVAQAYSFDKDLPQQFSAQDLRNREQYRSEGPLVASLRINPSQWTSFKADVVYSTLFKAVQSYSVTGGTRFGYHALGLTWRTNRMLDVGINETTSEQAQFYTTLGLWRDKVKLNSFVSYDIQRRELLQQRHILTWQARCLSFDLEYRERQLFSRANSPNNQPIVDRDYRFSLTLKNVGTFLDFSGSVDGF